MIQAIITACNATNTDSAPRTYWHDPERWSTGVCIVDRFSLLGETTSNRLLILDARSYAAAIANRAKGGGFEYPPYYADCDVQFMNLPNIHAIRKSAHVLRASIINTAQGER